jgi:hypothetical protein
MMKILDAGLRIPEGEPRIVEGKQVTDLSLITELLRLQATIHNKYLITVEAPEIKGLHDDQSDAFARAVYLASQYLNASGGVASNFVTESLSGSGYSYKKYATKQRKGVLYTNRPSAGLQMDMASRRHMNSMGSLSTRLRGR